MTARPPLVITPGDPAGIGPEVVCKALVAEPRPAILIGAGEAIRAWASRTGLTVGGPISLIEPDATNEPVEIAALRIAVAACLEGRARALVTGPIHKARLAKRGFPHHGHTEFLGQLSGVERPVMAFVGGRVRVALVTVHVPLRDVATRLTTDRVLHTIRAADRALRDHLGVARPRLAVCGPNPHAGDQGVLGDEDLRIVAPAVDAARAEGIDATGPVSAEAAFQFALQGQADLVVAAYHDQGLVPLKALAAAGASEEHAVNWTLGLPFVRTSVDHGTADDIAGKGIADAGSMLAAMRLAEELTL